MVAVPARPADRGRVVGDRPRDTPPYNARCRSAPASPCTRPGSPEPLSERSSVTRSPIPRALGLDAAFPALFLALLAGCIRDRRALAAALLGAHRDRADPVHAGRRADHRGERRACWGAQDVTGVWLTAAAVGVVDGLHQGARSGRARWSPAPRAVHERREPARAGGAARGARRGPGARRRAIDRVDERLLGLSGGRHRDLAEGAIASSATVAATVTALVRLAARGRPAARASRRNSRA